MNPDYHLPETLQELPDYFDTQQFMDWVCKQFAIWYDNKEFRQYINNFTSVMSSYKAQPVKMQLIFPSYDQQPALQRQWFVCIDDLLNPPPDIAMRSPLLCKVLESHSSDKRPAPCILDLVEKLEWQSKYKYEKGYMQQLQSSIKSLQKMKQMKHVTLDISTLQETLSNYQANCESYCQHVYATIVS